MVNNALKAYNYEVSDEIKKIKKHNDNLNKDFHIVPVEND